MSKAKKPIILVPQAAQELDLSIKQIQTLCRNGKIKAVKTKLGWEINLQSLISFKKKSYLEEEKIKFANKISVTREETNILESEELDPFIPRFESMGVASGAVAKDFKLHLEYSSQSIVLRCFYDVEKYTASDRILLHEQISKYGMFSIFNLQVLTDMIVSFNHFEVVLGEIVFFVASSASKEEKLLVLGELSNILNVQFKLEEEKLKKEVEKLINMRGPKEIIQ